MVSGHGAGSSGDGRDQSLVFSADGVGWRAGRSSDLPPAALFLERVGHSTSRIRELCRRSLFVTRSAENRPGLTATARCRALHFGNARSRCFRNCHGDRLPSRRRYDFVGAVLAFSLGMVRRRRGWFSWFCAIPSYSFASNCFEDAVSLACKDHAKAAACESENRADEGARGLGVDRTIRQHDFGALDYVWASTGIPATLLFGSGSDHLDRDASRDSACRERSAGF